MSNRIRQTFAAARTVHTGQSLSRPAIINEES